ncbi:RHS repeat domain-containing protein [Geobacillus zalihae]
MSPSDYSITAKVYFVDGTTQTYTADFPAGNQDWNRAAVSIQPSKPIDKIDISAVFRGNYTGTVWFDAIRLMEGNVVTKNKYDASGNYVTEEVDEEGYVAKKNYDAVGNLLSEYDKKGNKKEYTYDLSDRLKQLLLANGTSVNYDYDLNGNMTSKVIRTSDGQSQTFAYSYDAAGKLVKTVGPLHDVTTNEYDANGNKIKTVLPKGNTIQWTYDGTERVKTISYNNVPYYEFSYDKNGNELSVQYVKDGTTKTRKFDSANRVIEQSDRGGLQSGPIRRHRINYNSLCSPMDRLAKQSHTNTMPWIKIQSSKTERIRTALTMTREETFAPSRQKMEPARPLGMMTAASWKVFRSVRRTEQKFYRKHTVTMKTATGQKSPPRPARRRSIVMTP